MTDDIQFPLIESSYTDINDINTTDLYCECMCFKWNILGDVNKWKPSVNGNLLNTNIFNHPLSIQQGSIGSCWIVNVLYAIFRRPSLTMNILKRHSNSELSVRLCCQGIWIEVIIDEYLPYDKHGHMLCTTSESNVDQGIWVALIEKAFAKLHGSYGAI
ncbi:hypothetical protein GJ496_006069 [Pomphorhynchus laevis]|nr:hypothetical protein GJ496_006069 [Pomphorhynchus laevis]